MELVRIGDKVINKNKINRIIDKILKFRSRGLSQTEVARELDIERTLISRLESLGEVRKGKRIAVVGFPVSNSKELRKVALDGGAEFILLMSEKERWSFVDRDGLDIVNHLLEILIKLQGYDLVIFAGSDMRINLADTLLDGNVVGIELGISPITEDKYINPEELEKIIDNFSIC